MYVIFLTIFQSVTNFTAGHYVSRHPDLEHEQFGCLRVINEDRFEANNGFGMHSHREFEIFTYVISGDLDQYAVFIYLPRNDLINSGYSIDSMGNVEHLNRGDLQMTSAGTGNQHSERAGATPVHILQIWAFPRQSNLTPRYYTR